MAVENWVAWVPDGSSKQDVPNKAAAAGFRIAAAAYEPGHSSGTWLYFTKG